MNMVAALCLCLVRDILSCEMNSGAGDSSLSTDTQLSGVVADLIFPTLFLALVRLVNFFMEPKIHPTYFGGRNVASLQDMIPRGARRFILAKEI